MNKINRFVVVFLALAGMMAGVDTVCAQTWTGAGGKVWTNPDTNDFSPQYVNGATATFDGSGDTVTIDAGGVTPGAVVVNSSANYTFTGGGIGGTGSLTKMGSGTLSVTNANSFSGGVFINGGILFLPSGATSANLGYSGNLVIFTGAGTINFQGNTTLSQSFAINAGASGTFWAYKLTETINGPLSGSGTLNIQCQGDGYGGLFIFTSTNNTFSGDVVIYNSSGADYASALIMNS